MRVPTKPQLQAQKRYVHCLCWAPADRGRLSSQPTASVLVLASACLHKRLKQVFVLTWSRAVPYRQTDACPSGPLTEFGHTGKGDLTWLS